MVATAPTSLSPCPWQPSTTPKNLPAGNVLAGDWVQVFFSYRTTNSTAPVLTPGYFLFHVLVTPNSDDSTPHVDQPTTYGGNASNRRRVYRIDPGVLFQVPWNSQIAVVAGGNALSTCVLDVLLCRGHHPRRRSEIEFSPYGGGCPAPLDRIYPSPMVLNPPSVQLVPATWRGPSGIPAATPLEWPDGAQEIVAVDDSGLAGNAIPLQANAFGTSYNFNIASGIKSNIGALGQGGACSDGTPATWQHRIAPATVIQQATIFSSFGN